MSELKQNQTGSSTVVYVLIVKFQVIIEVCISLGGAKDTMGEVLNIDSRNVVC